MNWKLGTTRSGWHVIDGQRLFAVELPRLFGILNDPASWPVSPPQRLIKLEHDTVLGYSFSNKSRVELSLTQVKPGVVLFRVRHENLRTDADLAWAKDYWHQVFESAASRLLSEPVLAATAYGKLNLFFRVGPLQPDGYHQVASLYQSVTLPETVIAEPQLDPEGDWYVATGGSVSPAHLASVPTDSRNLVVKAAKAVAKAAKVRKPAKLLFFVDKHVPVAGGMGGGSADAAAAIVVANRFYGDKLGSDALLALAADLGADVPFALAGGAAIGVGTGHELQPIKQLSQLHWVLVTDELGLSTPAVYAELDRLRAARGKDPRAVRQAAVNSALVTALRKGASAEELAPLLHNDLQEAAVSLRPDLQRLLDLAEPAGSLKAIVSGSGPTVAYLARSAQDSQAIQSRLTTFGVPNAIVTTSPGGPARLLD